MENNNLKGSEFKNVQDTWDQNERNLKNGNNGTEDSGLTEAAPTTDLERLIKEEASEYDKTNKEDRILGGDRATVNDDENESSD